MEIENDYLVIDLETSVNNVGEDAIGDMKASPFHPDNKIVAVGSKCGRSSAIYMVWMPSKVTDISCKNCVIVGHNIAFDLHYLLKEDYNGTKRLLANNTIWDTQLAEYILSGQTKMYPSLDYCAAKYGGTIKDEKIKEYWDAGVKTEDIPREELEEYLMNDIKNTELVFLNQVKEAERQGLMNLMRTQMEARLATIEMEFNGMCVDKYVINSGIVRRRQEKSQTEHHIKAVILPHMCSHPHLINLASDEHVSILLFGGSVDVEQRVPMKNILGLPVVFKSGEKKGQPRFTKEVVTVSAPGLYTPNPEWELKKKGFYSTAHDIISSLTMSPIVDALLRLRDIDKDLSTYFIGYSKLIWPSTNVPNSSGYGIIHQSLNHCVTKTGRLSCTKPNLQNVSGED